MIIILLLEVNGISIQKTADEENSKLHYLLANKTDVKEVKYTSVYRNSLGLISSTVPTLGHSIK